MILAAIDLGTNTGRLMVAEAEDNTHRLIVRGKDRAIIRLGQGFSQRKMILPENAERAIEVIRRFQDQARDLGAESIRLIGTSALREAENSKAVLDRIYQQTGLSVQAISGEIEAKLTAYGAMQTLALPSVGFAIADVGGGSSEFVLFPHQGQPYFLSIPLGVIWLTEKFLLHDPPREEEYEQMSLFIHDYLLRTLSCFQLAGQVPFIGTGGSATTLAALKQGLREYNPEKINSFRLTAFDLRQIEGILRPLPLKDRCEVSGLEKGREDIILAGLSLFLAFMDILKVSEITISDGGLLEGILFHQILPASFLENFS